MKKVVEVVLERIIESPKIKRYEDKIEIAWKEIIEALRENPKHEDYQFVYEPIDVICVSKTGNRAIYPDCFFRIEDGRHRYLALKVLRAKTIKVRFEYRDIDKEIAEELERRKQRKFEKIRRCKNCHFLVELDKGKEIIVNDVKKLCFFFCSASGNYMTKEESYNLNECENFKEKEEEN